jgi:uncharacterized protein (TIGR03083 family)
MNANAIAVEAIEPISYEEAMDLAEAEYARLIEVVESLDDGAFAAQTDCAGWTVKDVLGHLLGMLALQADPEELARQLKSATEAAARSGRLRLDELTDLQVREHAELSPGDITSALGVAAPRALAARRALPVDRRAVPYDPQLPGENGWTLGYLFGIIHTRDPWLHRVDICRATGADLVLTGDHDGRLIQNVVAEWAGKHGAPFVLELAGPAGGRYEAHPCGAGGEHITLDAVQFCRILSGRAPGAGLLQTRVTF